MPCNPFDHRLKLDRRSFLTASGLGFCGMHLPAIMGNAAKANLPISRKPAKSTILIWLYGGASHIDTWDMKPDAPSEYRGEFNPIQTSAPGISLCEHLPHLATCAHHLAVVRSLEMPKLVIPNDHHGGHYYNFTGHPTDDSFRNADGRDPLPTDWPFIGSVIAKKRPPHPYLPQLVWLPRPAGNSGLYYPGQYGARLGGQYDPLFINGQEKQPLEFSVPSLSLLQDLTPERLASRRELMKDLDGAHRSLDQSVAVSDLNEQQQLAFSLLSSQQTKSAFDVSREPVSIREKYGKGMIAMSMLMARRLVEAGVPFITVNHQSDDELVKKHKCGGGWWDTHGNNFGCLKSLLLPELDRPLAALIEDLHVRGMLEDTLILVNSEMGRNPKVGDRRTGGAGSKTPGRDHWTHCMSVLFAGGGIQGGQTYGASDKVAAYPSDKPVSPEDIAKTIYYAMGIENLDAVDRDGRPFDLMADGRPLTELF